MITKQNCYKNKPYYDEFQRINLKVIEHSNLSMREKYLFIHLQTVGTFLGERNGYLQFGYPMKKLNADLEWDRRCVRSYIKKLEEMGYLRREGRKFLIPKVEDTPFVIVPKELVFDAQTYCFRSNREGIVMYALILNRLRYSFQNHKQDADGTLRVFYPIEQLAKDLGICEKTAWTYLDALEKDELILKEHQNVKQASILYVPIPWFDTGYKLVGSIYQ